MKIKIIIIIILSSFYGYSQQDWLELSKEVISKNRVEKVVEFDARDSAQFFTKYPNGYYFKFDSKGNMIEKNGYSPCYIDSTFHNGEYTSYWIFDSNGHEICYLLMDKTWRNPIQKLEISNYNADNSINYAHYNSFDDKNISFTKSGPIGDTVPKFDTIQINKTSYKIIYKEDTTYQKVYFISKNGSVDSSITNSKCSSFGRDFPCYTKTVYEYRTTSKKSLSVKSVYGFHEKNRKDMLSDFTRYYFMPNGLLEKYTGKYLVNGKSFEHKYTYHYRKKKTTRPKTTAPNN